MSLWGRGCTPFFCRTSQDDVILLSGGGSVSAQLPLSYADYAAFLPVMRGVFLSNVRIDSSTVRSCSQAVPCAPASEWLAVVGLLPVFCCPLQGQAGLRTYVNVRVHVGLSYVLGNCIWNCTFLPLLGSVTSSGPWRLLVCSILGICVYKFDNHGLIRIETLRSKVHKDVILQR